MVVISILARCRGSGGADQSDRNQVFRAVLEKRGRIFFFRVTVTEGCRGRTGGFIFFRVTVTEGCRGRGGGLLRGSGRVGVECIFGVGGGIFRVVVMVGWTGGLLNVIEKVGLVDFIGERSAAGENKG